MDRGATQFSAAPILSLAPDYLSAANPKMRPAAYVDPYGRMERHISPLINRNVPSRFHFLQHHHLKPLSATARTAQSHAPIFAIIAREHQIARGQLGWQHIALHNLQKAAAIESSEEAPPPQRLSQLRSPSIWQAPEDPAAARACPRRPGSSTARGKSPPRSTLHHHRPA